MQSTSHRMPGSMSHTLKSSLPGEITIRNADVTVLMVKSGEELKSLMMRVKEECEKTDLKLKSKKLTSWHLVPSLHSK